MSLKGELLLCKERMDEYIATFKQLSPINRYFGMELSFADGGSAVVDLPYNPNLDHGMGGIHGGVYATLMDTAGWYTAVMALDKDCWVATTELSIHLLEPVKRTSLRAVGRLLKAGKRQNIVEIFLYDGNRSLVGHATGTFMILPHLNFLFGENAAAD